MNIYRSAAIEVLKKSRKPLHYQDITQKALELGILETEGATPEKSMGAQLYMDIKSKGKASDFTKISEGIFALNENKDASPLSSKEIEAEIEADEAVKIESGYTGKGGEHLVCSELLFRGFNASIMSVDVGMDIIATKESKLYSIQVKTSNLNSYQTYVFDIRKVSLERDHSGNIFYVFVLRGEKETNYLILPNVEVEKKVYESAILPVGNNKRYRVNIKFRNDTIYLGNKDHDMSYYLNNWALIK